MFALSNLDVIPGGLAFRQIMTQKRNMNLRKKKKRLMRFGNITHIRLDFFIVLCSLTCLAFSYSNFEI